QGGNVAVIPQSIGGGSNPIAALNVEPSQHPLESSSNNNSEPNHDQKLGWRKFFVIYRPWFPCFVSLFSSGKLMKALQSSAAVGGFDQIGLAVNLGVSTGKHLSELGKAEYPRMVKYCLWILAEIAVIAADMPKVIGTAFGLNILFNIPVYVGVLLTSLSTLLLLGLQRYGIINLCLYMEMSYVKPPASGVVNGMFVPKLNGQGATGDAIALLGALVMP
ncbi:hypothetical protein Goklo_029325, partial [Gossypium klotzschianum]|nr:hypothetical protein [Gossypium klotzschianum]